MTAAREPSPHDVRVKELSRMSKRELASIIRRNHPNMWTAHPLETWNKDELVNDILRDEFPTVTA